MTTARGYKFTISVEFVVEECASCHVPFAISVDHRKELLQTKKSFYCPNGHSQHYTAETEADRLRRERDQLQQRIAQKDDEIREVQQSLKRAHKRTAAGVCPCCKRSVRQLALHVKQAHPEYAKEHLGEAGALPDENKIVRLPPRRRKRA